MLVAVRFRNGSADPPTRDIEIAVREVPHGHVSALLARRTRPGDILEVRGPFGFLTWTERDGGPLGLVGAGTGASPLAAIIRYAAARGSEIPMTLLCSRRDRSDALLGNELRPRRHPGPEMAMTITYRGFIT